MDIASTASPQSRALAQADFASEYERFAALAIARAGSLGGSVLGRLYTQWERRSLLALAERPAGVAHRDRLEPAELESVRAQLAVRTREIESLGRFDAPLFRNVAVLGERLGLDAVQQALLAMGVIGETVAVLREFFDALGPLLADRSAVARAFGAMLALAPDRVQSALDPQAPLATTGLLVLNLHMSEEPLLGLREGLAGILLDAFDAADGLFAQFAKPARAPALASEDFEHLGGDIDIVANVVANADGWHEPGVNIMLYGPPGTGKTELARVLAARAGLALHEIRHTTEGGRDMTRARYGQIALAQRLMRSVRGIVLLFDETEDLLPRDGPDGRRLGKAAFNELLETNPVPMIWISNAIEHIDPAYLRRFAYLLEVKKPSRSVRRRIIERSFGRLVGRPDWLDAMALHADAAPAQFAQAARVARLAGDGFDPASVGERVLAAGMRAMGQRSGRDTASIAAFDPRYLNCNADPARLASGLRTRPAGSLLFCGPPGTGKSALAKYLADQIDRPLLIKRASDLLSKWVGECEANIARAFAEASEEKAVLVIDEAESFLADRRDARARWEITETNELLTQMEDFDGIFICTTNLLDRLDRAALRRFALKVRFEPLRPEQTRALVAATLAALGAAALGPEAASILDRLVGVTPGDIAAVAARYRVLGEQPRDGEFVRALTEEIAMKDAGSGLRIGF